MRRDILGSTEPLHIAGSELKGHGGARPHIDHGAYRDGPGAAGIVEILGVQSPVHGLTRVRRDGRPRRPLGRCQGRRPAPSEPIV